MINQREYKWITIRELSKSASGKTGIYIVFNRDYPTEPLGYIKWSPSFRKYSLYPERDTFFEEVCLGNIIEFLKELKEDKKDEK